MQHWIIVVNGECAQCTNGISYTRITNSSWTQNIETDMITLSLKLANEFVSLSLALLRSILQNGNNETIKIQLNRSLNVLNAMAVHGLLTESGWFNDDYYFCFHIKKRNVRTSNFASPTPDFECWAFCWWHMMVFFSKFKFNRNMHMARAYPIIYLHTMVTMFRAKCPNILIQLPKANRMGTTTRTQTETRKFQK